MSTDHELWGTLSVKDHLRPGSFAAELLLFDRLVVPRPPRVASPDGAWPQEWGAEVQDRLISLLPPDRVMEVTWTRNHPEWLQKWTAIGVEEDINEIKAVRAATGFDEAQQHEKFDDPAFALTRRVLQDFADEARSEQQLQGIPGADLTVIPAYHSPLTYADEQAPGQSEVLLQAFGWEFLVPHHETYDGKTRSPEDQVKAALDLCQMPEVAAHRDAFRGWMNTMGAMGKDIDTTRAMMEDKVAAYAKAVAAGNAPVRVKWGVGIAKAAGGVAAMALNPMFALAGVGLDLLELAAEGPADKAADIPNAVKPAALIHAMRQEFTTLIGPSGWQESDARITLKDHWPHGAPSPYL